MGEPAKRLWIADCGLRADGAVRQPEVERGLQGLRIHFVGVAGIGMSALAQIAMRLGAEVSGCDVRECSTTRELVGRGARCSVGHDVSHVENGIGLVVHTSAVSPEHPELVHARELGIPVVPRASFLAELMSSKQGVAVTGTHGKTTTTWLTAKILIEGGLDPTVVVGGIVPELGTNFRVGNGETFVAEADESDGLFTEARPRYGVVTNIDREHLDHYRDIEEICSAFGEFMANVSPEGTIVGCAHDRNVCGLSRECGRKRLLYGLSPKATVRAGLPPWKRSTDAPDLRAENVVVGKTSSRFDAVCEDFAWHRIRLNIPGAHNVLNALAAIAVARLNGVEEEAVRTALGKVKGVRRRFEVRWRHSGITCVDDYGHHPTEVLATLQTARKFRDGRLFVVFQPHRYTRTKALADEFGHAFNDADEVIVTSIYAASEKPLPGITGELLVHKIGEFGRSEVRYMPDRKAIAEYLAKSARPGDTVLTLGAGDINLLGEELLGAL